jgi:malonyl CoA-acyl carrier protein transacylase
MRDAAKIVEKELNTIHFQKPIVPFISNVTAEEVPQK